jgi:2-keto-3-deoxy-L-rhamnonate aldolase RhmA
MTLKNLRDRMAAGDILAGTFLKTPSHVMIEVLAHSGLDFICLDAEHAPFDRAGMDACMAVARALDLPVLVRVSSAEPSEILTALDLGATGIVVPHVDTVEKAQAISRAARFGRHGRGFAGSTRWAGYATRKMPELLEKSARETIVIAQIEEPEGVEAAAAIAAVDGIDGLFVGPADLSLAYGRTDLSSRELKDAMAATGKACRDAGKTYMTWVPNTETAATWHADHGFTMFFVASEHAWILQGARAVTAGIHALKA